MKEFNVKEIADMLKTNPETVRRWIRDGKLKADQSTRRGGNTISEQSLNEFLKTTPKYAGIAAGTIGLLGIPAIVADVPVLTATLMATMLAQKKINEDMLKKAKISITEISRFISTSIKSSEKTISAKEEEIKKLKMEIKAEMQHIQELKALSEELRVLNEQSNSDKKE